MTLKRVQVESFPFLPTEQSSKGMDVNLPAVCKGKNCYGTLRNSHLPTCLTQGHGIKYLSTSVVMVLVRRLEFRNATQRSPSWAEVRASHTLQSVPEAMPLPGKKSPDSCFFSCVRLEDTQQAGNFVPLTFLGACSVGMQGRTVSSHLVLHFQQRFEFLLQ